MKKTISLLLAVVLLLGLAAGCGQPATPDSDTPETKLESTEAKGGEESKEKEPAEQNKERDFFDGEFDPNMTGTSIQEVIYIQGTWYDMGRQYARQQSELIKRVYMSYITRMLKEANIERIYELANSYMENFKETEPDIYNFVNGVAEELKISLEDAAIATFCNRMNLTGMTEGDGKEPEKESCMSASVWGSLTVDGHVVGACNLDEGIDVPAQYSSSIVSFPEGDYAVVMGAGLMSNAVLNSNGVMLLYSGQTGATGEQLNYDYLNSIPFLWYVAAKSATAEEAIEMLTSHDLYKVGNINVTDVNGSASVLENATLDNVIRKPGDLGETEYLVAANHFYSEELSAYAYPEGVFTDSIPRCETVERIILDNAGKVDEGVLARAVGSREYYMDGKWSGENWELGEFQYHSPEMCDYIDKTIIRTIIDATDLELYTLRGHYDYYTSHIPYTTAQYTKLTIADSIAGTNRQADMDARLMLWYASYDLDHAAVKDAEKTEYLQMGNQKVQEGLNYTLMAQYAETKGNTDKAIEYYGLATSAFCRAQQYGQAAQIENNTFMK